MILTNDTTPPGSLIGRLRPYTHVGFIRLPALAAQKTVENPLRLHGKRPKRKARSLDIVISGKVHQISCRLSGKSGGFVQPYPPQSVQVREKSQVLVFFVQVFPLYI